MLLFNKKNISKYSILTYSFCLFIYLLLLFYYEFKTLPHGIHEWAQADRLALAYGYYDNGLNFLYPMTLSQVSLQGITGVEFPIQAYLTAIFAQLFGRESIHIIFKIVNFSILYIGLIFIFKQTFIISKHFWTAILPIIILLSSPVLLNYSFFYLPDGIASIISIIGCLYYLRIWMYGDENKRVTALVLLTLAFCMKTSLGIYWIAFVSLDFIFLMKAKVGYLIRMKRILLYALFVIFPILFFLYNQHLNSTYQSALFLMQFKPLNFDSLKFVLGRMIQLWSREYFVFPVYIYFIIMTVFLFNKKKVVHRYLFYPLIGLLLLGIIVVFILMGQQFIDHDYYFIGIFIPFIFILFLVHGLSFSDYYTSSFKYIHSFLYVAFLYLTYSHIQQRNAAEYLPFSEWYRSPWYEGAEEKLTKLNISKEEKVACVSESAPNLSLVYMNRKGFVFAPEWWGNDFNYLTNLSNEYGFNFIVSAKDYWIKNVINNQRNYENFQLIFEDEKLVVLRKK